jgi:hypothetical protein
LAMSYGLNLGRAGAAALVTMLALIPAYSEAGDVSGAIPFSFKVNGATLPPGTYRLTTGQPGPGVLLVRGPHRIVIAMTSPRGPSKDFQPKLVFNRYGDDYFLSQVWTDSGSGLDLRETRDERERKERRSGSAAVQPDRVVVPGL